MMPKIFTVVLNWNGSGDTIECVESLKKVVYPNHNILIVDNGSTDGSESILRSLFPDIEVIQTGANLGYAGGNNIGIRHALERGADYIWLLNNDTIVDSRCLKYMVCAAEAGDRVGMVGSKIYYLDSPETIWFAGGKVDLGRGGLTSHIGMGLKDEGLYDEPAETDYITGCSILARREMIDDVGLLDENYFLYFEDSDWCLRARKNGWKLLYEPRARLWHKEGARESEGYSERFIYYSLRNRLYFMKRFAPEKMFSSHLLQLRMSAYFAKSSLMHGMMPFFRVLKVVLLSYSDFYIFKKMGYRNL